MGHRTMHRAKARSGGPGRSPSRTPAVVIPSLPDQRFACHGCTQCCRDTTVPLSDRDLGELRRQDWSGLLDREPFVRLGSEWVLDKNEDGACVFLDGDGRCRIHSRYGPRAKPLACQLFPFGLAPDRDGGWRCSVRYDCPTVARSEGRPLADHRRDLARLARDLTPADDATLPVELRRGVAIGPRALQTIVDALDGVFGDPERSWASRLAAAVLATEELATTDLEDAIVGRRLRERLAEPADGVGAATARSRRMLRELVFAHADAVSFQQRRAGHAATLTRVWKRLRGSTAFSRGRGVLPALARLPGGVSAAVVESVDAAADEDGRIEALITRYVRMRLQSRTFCGPGFHGWPVLEGLHGLWASVALTGWLARWVAAGDGRPAIGFEDVVRAVGVVDLGALQLPPRRRLTCRLRLEYLGHEGRLLALIHSCPLVSSSHPES